jgi:hypothetical protein
MDELLRIMESSSVLYREAKVSPSQFARGDGKRWWRRIDWLLQPIYHPLCGFERIQPIRW